MFWVRTLMRLFINCKGRLVGAAGRYTIDKVSYMIHTSRFLLFVHPLCQVFKRSC